jgi:hypothetical protein
MTVPVLYARPEVVCFAAFVAEVGSAIAERAGFERVEVVPIAHDLWRFYRLGAR